MTKAFADGDRVGHTASAAITQYDAVKLTGEREVAPVDTSDEEVWGIALMSAEPGEDVTVVQRGEYTAHVSSAVSVPADLTASTTAGQLRAVDGAAGETAQGLKAVEALPEDNRALVYVGY